MIISQYGLMYDLIIIVGQSYLFFDDLVILPFLKVSITIKKETDVAKVFSSGMLTIEKRMR